LSFSDARTSGNASSKSIATSEWSSGLTRTATNDPPDASAGSSTWLTACRQVAW